VRKWLEDQLAAGLPALAGSRVAGTLAVAPALVNDLISAWLSRQPSDGTAADGVDLAALRETVKSVSVRAEPDRILVDFEVRL
jgi:hypothetical protein